MLKKIIIAILVSVLMTGCSKEVNNNETSNNLQEETKKLEDKYEVADLYSYKEENDGIYKHLHTVDDKYAYFDYYQDRTTYKALSIGKENMQTGEKSLLYDFSNGNYQVDWIEKFNDDLYINYYNSDNNVNYIARMEEQLEVLDEGNYKVSKFHQVGNKLYYTTEKDDIICIKVIENGKVQTLKEINALPYSEYCFESSVLGRPSEEYYVYVYYDTVYCFKDDIKEYKFDYILADAGIFDHYIITNQYYTEEINGTKQANYKSHIYDLNTKQDIDVVDYKRCGRYYDDDHCLIYAVNSCIYILDIYDNQAIQAKINDYDKDIIYISHIRDNYYLKHMKDGNIICKVK